VSYSEVQYALRQLRAPTCFRVESFPLDTAKHPGWIDIPKLTGDPSILTADATATTIRLAAQPNSRVWLFDSNGQRCSYEINIPLKAILGQQMFLAETLKLSGTYLD
jgi:hypothetical protein